MRFLIVLVLVVTALAGCSDGPAPVDDEPINHIDVDTGPDVGAISGVVVSETIVPIDGATVAIPSGAQTITDSDGRFVFEDLDPGVFFLEVSAPGYLATQTSVEVVAGEVAKPRVLLAFDQSPTPYHVTHPYQGFMQVYGTSASFALHVGLQIVGQSICECEWDLPLDSVPAEVVVEGFWEDSVPDPQGPQQYYLEVFDSGINDCLDTGRFPSGFRTNITECAWTADNYRIALTGPSTWVALQQSYELFATTFYRAASPADWSVANG